MIGDGYNFLQSHYEATVCIVGPSCFRVKVRRYTVNVLLVSLSEAIYCRYIYIYSVTHAIFHVILIRSFGYLFQCPV